MKVDAAVKSQPQITIVDNQITNKPLHIEVLVNDHIKININDLKELKIIYQNVTLPVVLEIKGGQKLNLFEVYKGHNSLTKKVVINNDCQITSLILNQSQTLNQTSHFTILKNSALKIYVCNLENGATKQKIHFDLNAWKAQVKGTFGTITSLSDQMDFEIYCNHNNKETYSDIKNFGIAKDKSFYRFNIWGVIEEKKDDVETHQKQKILVFNPEVKLETNPYLIINHNNVKASHGVAIGKINEHHLFYLQTRGINKPTAKRLIVWGYFLPLILKIKNPQIQNIVRTKINERIEFNV